MHLFGHNSDHIMFGSSLPGLGWFAPPKSTRALEPTLLWNQLHSLPCCEGLFSLVKRLDTCSLISPQRTLLPAEFDRRIITP